MRWLRLDQARPFLGSGNLAFSCRSEGVEGDAARSSSHELDTRSTGGIPGPGLDLRPDPEPQGRGRPGAHGDTRGSPVPSHEAARPPGSPRAALERAVFLE